MLETHLGVSLQLAEEGVVVAAVGVQALAQGLAVLDQVRDLIVVRVGDEVALLHLDQEAESLILAGLGHLDRAATALQAEREVEHILLSVLGVAVEDDSSGAHLAVLVTLGLEKTIASAEVLGVLGGVDTGGIGREGISGVGICLEIIQHVLNLLGAILVAVAQLIDASVVVVLSQLPGLPVKLVILALVEGAVVLGLQGVQVALILAPADLLFDKSAGLLVCELGENVMDGQSGVTEVVTHHRKSPFQRAGV